MEQQELDGNELVPPPNNYSSSDLIGKGGYGEVYKAEWKGRRVAVKVLIPSEMKKERNIYQRTHHPHIAEFIGFGQMLGVSFLVLEYGGGGTLDQMIADNYEKVDWSYRIDIALQVADSISEYKFANQK